MTLEATQLAELDQDTVDQAFAYGTQLVAEKHDNLDIKRGVLADLVFNLDAILAAAERLYVDRWRRSNSLAAISADPALADDAFVDNVISTYGLTRRAAQAASGEVTIVLSQAAAVTIGNGAIFTADGQEFASTGAFAARTSSANVLDDTDRLRTQIGEGRYAFTISVEAVEAGAASMLRKDTRLVPSSPPPAFVTAYAASDFIGGIDLQTNSELLQQLQEGLSPKAYSNRVSLPATLHDQEAFADVLHVSSVGYGDPEMLRDQHWLFPVSGGGRADIYVRSQELPQETTLTVTATLIDDTADGSIWQFSLDKTQAAGLYEVIKIKVATDTTDTAGYEVTADLRSLDLTDADYVPDLQTAVEGVFSAYQTATIRFLDTDTSTGELTVNTSQQDYHVTLRSMPLVAEIQAFLGDRDVTNPVGDLLVKAPVPCFLGLSFTLERRHTDATIDEDEIKTQLAAYVNNLGFPGKLYASSLSRIIAERLPDHVDVGAIDMFGRLRLPDTTTRYVRSNSILTIPDLPTVMTTGRTVGLFLDPADIAISIVSVDVPEV